MTTEESQLEQFVMTRSLPDMMITSAELREKIHAVYLAGTRDWACQLLEQLKSRLAESFCPSCSAYEDRLEEIRMAVTLDRTSTNPYRLRTIEHSIWELRQTIEDLRKRKRKKRKARR